MLDSKTDVAKMPNKMDERARNCRMPRAVEREPIKLSHCPLSTDFLRINPYAVRCKSIDRNRTIEPSIDRSFNANNINTELEMHVCVCVQGVFCLLFLLLFNHKNNNNKQNNNKHSCNWAHTYRDTCTHQYTNTHTFLGVGVGAKKEEAGKTFCCRRVSRMRVLRLRFASSSQAKWFVVVRPCQIHN